ncbi:glutaminyl-peptide cyclotransferase [Maricaulis sp. CAU 1757]
MMRILLALLALTACSAQAPAPGENSSDAGQAAMQGSAEPASEAPATLAAPAPIAVPERWRAEILAAYPHDPEAFTQGLFFSDGQLFESTGQYGESTLRQIDLETGEVVRQHALEPRYFGEGSTRFGDIIYMLSWRSGTGFMFDADSLEPVDTFSYPGEGWGLTRDDSHLILSDGTARLRRLDPETLQLTGTLDVTLNGRPVRRLNELEWINGEIWANVWQTPIIVRIDPQSGVVTGLVDLSGLVPSGFERERDAVANGIAWDPETDRLFVTGKLWPEIYEVRLIQVSRAD